MRGLSKIPCVEIRSLSLRLLNSQAQSSLKRTYTVHPEGNLQSDIQEDPGRRMEILRKEGASPSLYYARHTESTKYLPFRSTGARCGFTLSLPLAFALSFNHSLFNHLPTLLNWPSQHLLFQLFSFFFFSSRPLWTF